MAATSLKEIATNQNKIIDSEIASTKSRYVELQNTCDLLDAEFISSEAKKKNDVNLIVRADVLRCKSDKKRAEKRKLEDAIKSLEKKRKKV